MDGGSGAVAINNSVGSTDMSTGACQDVNWSTASLLSIVGSGVACGCCIVALLAQLYICRFLKKKPLLIRLQLNTLLTCILTFAVYIVISLSTNTVYFSKAACIGLGSAFYVLLLSSIFWLSTEPLVSIVFVRKLKSVQHNYSNVVLKAACINYGVPMLFMLVLHLASSVSTPLFGDAFDYTSKATQFCWMRDKTAMFVAMTGPAVSAILASIVCGVIVHRLYKRLECSQLHFPPWYRLLIAPSYGIVWIIAALGNGHFQADSSGCDSAFGFIIAFLTLVILVSTTILILHISAAWRLSQLPEHEKLASQALVFIMQRPLVLGSDIPGSPTLSQASDATQLTSLSSTQAGFTGTNNRKKGKKGAEQESSFTAVMADLPPLPSKFTLRPGGTSKHSVAAGSPPEIIVNDTGATGDDETAAVGGSTAEVSLAEAVLDKSRSAVDMTRGLQLDDPLTSGASLPNISHMLKAEKEKFLLSQIPVPQSVEEVYENDYGHNNQSFDELDSDLDNDKKPILPARTSPTGTMQAPVVSDRKANDSGPDGESHQSTHDEPSQQPAQGNNQLNKSKSSRSSKTLPERTPHAVADEQKRSTWPNEPVYSAVDQNRHASLGRKSSTNNRFSRKDSWQSSEFDSSEVDTLPKTRSLPGHKKHRPDGQEAPVAAARSKRTASRKTLQGEDDGDEPTDNYLMAHSETTGLASIDEQTLYAQPGPAMSKKRPRSATTNAIGRPSSIKASSEGNLPVVGSEDISRTQSVKNIAGEKKKKTSTSGQQKPKSPLAPQDPRYWQQAGYPPGNPYGPGYSPYGYGHYPPPGYANQYNPYYGGAYGAPPYGYGPYYGQQQAPPSARQAKLAKKQARMSARSNDSLGIYDQATPRGGNAKGHSVRFPM